MSFPAPISDLWNMERVERVPVYQFGLVRRFGLSELEVPLQGGTSDLDVRNSDFRVELERPLELNARTSTTHPCHLGTV